MPVALGIVASHRTATAVAAPPAGMAGWWDASDATTLTHIANAISQWRDKSGNAWHAAWANASWPATLIPAAINGLAAIDFHPGSLNTVLATGTKPFSIVAAVKTGPASGGTELVGAALGYTSGDIVNWDHSVGYMRLLERAVALVGQATSPYTANSPAVLGLTYDTGNVWTHYRNGAAVGTGTTAATFAASALCIGGGLNPNAGNYDGLLGEFLWYSRILTGPELTQIQSYLKTKWGTP